VPVRHFTQIGPAYSATKTPTPPANPTHTPRRPEQVLPDKEWLLCERDTTNSHRQGEDSHDKHTSKDKNRQQRERVTQNMKHVQPPVQHHARTSTKIKTDIRTIPTKRTQNHPNSPAAAACVAASIWQGAIAAGKESHRGVARQVLNWCSGSRQRPVAAVKAVRGSLATQERRSLSTT
jgi:hypothetical protein